jgi:hypothetical protein
LTCGCDGFPWYPSPLEDSRTPDIIVLPQPGVIYDPIGTTALEDHGGFHDYDVELPILLFMPGMPQTQIDVPVNTRSVAPTILTALGLNPGLLVGSVYEGTQVLPGWIEAASHASSQRMLAAKP